MAKAERNRAYMVSTTWAGMLMTIILGFFAYRTESKNARHIVITVEMIIDKILIKNEVQKFTMRSARVIALVIG